MTEAKPVPFGKVLVANRGEIAVRIIRACREMGIKAVAVYSQPDATALHVQVADEAYLIGPAAPRESYLNIPALLAAARESAADAVHPGYGFLAENADFAQAVRDAGLVWIGPAPEVIRLMGDKVAAKELASRAGVPTVPGYMGEDQSPDRIRAEAARVGFPIMLKASAGGGGKGMRVVASDVDLPAALEGAKREALSAFGDDRVFVEKLVEHPRHIEIQIMADTHGNAVYLGERDCSLQRRHQKVVEESPSPVITPEMRAEMGEAALRLVRASDYTSAGTVEFLFGGDNFYFLEMNTRIQVEHPVTEMVTGLDLIRLQLIVAAGEALPFSQLDVDLHGHAIEVRLYAENPEGGFLPSTGPIEVYLPAAGPGVRNDIGIFAGAEVLPYYDPLLAKLIVHAAGRRQALARLRQALADTVILGPRTNLQFLRWLMEQPEVVAGRADTNFIADHWHEPEELPPPPEVILAAAAYQTTRADTATQTSSNPWQQSSGWRVGGAGRTIRYEAGGRAYTVEVSRASEGRWKLSLDGSPLLAEVDHPAPHLIVLRDGAQVVTCHLAVTETGVEIDWRGAMWRLRRPRVEVSAGGTGPAAGGHESLNAPMPGTVIKVDVVPGQEVSDHEPLVVLEAMKMEHVIQAPHAGVVRDVMCKVGDLVQAGAPLVDLEQK